MQKRIGLLLLLVSVACGDDPLDPVCAAMEVESLDLEVVGVVPAQSDLPVAGVDLDGQVSETDWVDPDGTLGIDGQGYQLDETVDLIYETTLDSTLVGNTFLLEVRYASDPDGLCSGLEVALDGDAPQPAMWTNGSWRTNGVLGDRTVAITLRGVATEVPFRDIGVRLVPSEAGLTEVTVGGWISVDDLYSAVIAGFDEAELEDYGEVAGFFLLNAADMAPDADGVFQGVSFMLRTQF